jgi:hypothetical protein
MTPEAVKNFIDEAMKRVKAAYQTIIDQLYIGGPPKTDDVGSGTAGTEQNYIIFPPSIKPLVASDAAVMLPHGNGKSIIGVPVAPHLGKPLHDSYWLVPVESPTVETTLAVSSRARRVTAPKSMPITVATVNVTTAQGGSTATIKIYADDGTTTPVLLWTSNGISTTGTGPKKSTATSPFWVYMGWEYIIVYENTDATVAVTAHTLSANADNILNDGQAQIATTAANIVGNTPNNVVDFPLIKFT